MWLLLAARVVGFVGSQMAIVHMLAFLFLAGYGEMQAAFAIGTAGLLGIGGRPGIGLLSDILGREIVYTFSMAMTVAAVMVVLFFSSVGLCGRWWPLWHWRGSARASWACSSGPRPPTYNRPACWAR